MSTKCGQRSFLGASTIGKEHMPRISSIMIKGIFFIALPLRRRLMRSTWKAVKNSRNAFRGEKGGTIIPFGRIITNLLVHSKIVESLESEGIIKDLAVTSGACLNAFSLKKMKIIDTILKAPQPLAGTRTIREPVLADFETIFNSEVPEVRTIYLKTLKENKSLKDQDKGAPFKVNRKREERTKRKHDYPSAVSKKQEVSKKVIAN